MVSKKNLLEYLFFSVSTFELVQRSDCGHHVSLEAVLLVCLQEGRKREERETTGIVEE